jgi:hypothetical protein
VEFVVVNSDPFHTSVRLDPPALRVPGLSGLSDMYFLTGPLAQLNAVWSTYGLAVHVGATHAQIAHNNVLYFISPRGRLRSLAVPFANEDHSGIYRLAPTDVQRFARGIATVASSLSR